MSAVAADARIGFVGLGNLGQPMARALLRDGWNIAVVDSAPEKAEPCVADGARAAAGPLDLAGCAAVALAVPDDAAVEDVLCASGLLDALAPGAVVLVHSTILPVTARRLASVAGERRIGLLDAPVSGGAERALAGELTVMVGGEQTAVDRARPLLDAVGADVRHVGPSGAGCAVKLANQLMMFGALAGVHEALDLARAYGVDERAVLTPWPPAPATRGSYATGASSTMWPGHTTTAARPCASGRGARTCGTWSRPPGPPTSRFPSRGCSRRCSPRA
jgi:3-hydroxyisobutyrate dehydrogenase